MKVIGITQNGFILESSRDEVANLIGFYSAYSDKAKINDLKTGTEIKVSDMYSQLYGIAAIRRKITDAQKELRAAADKLDPVVPILPVITLPEQ